MKTLTEQIASKHLGKTSDGSPVYDPSLLVAIPREENRRQYDIDSSNLPFWGWDVWHAYEFSVLTSGGIPITRVLKIKYNCSSDFIVESKSLKLYLNSYNMSKFGIDISECLNICKKQIASDLSNILKTEVQVEYLDNTAKKCELFLDYVNIFDLIDESKIQITDFKENPVLLKINELKDFKSHKLYFDSLRSNCRVTHQPDFGDVFIYYKSRKRIQEDSLIKYLTSFRSEYHFHEECCEMIYKRLCDLLDNNDELMVCALYTRRGGIDISPVRYSKNCAIRDAESLEDLKSFARYGIKQ